MHALGDLAVGQTLGDELGDLPFAAGELRGRSSGALGYRLDLFKGEAKSRLRSNGFGVKTAVSASTDGSGIKSRTGIRRQTSTSGFSRNQCRPFEPGDGCYRVASEPE